MTQAGDMAQEDIEHLRKALVSKLPEDEHQQPVLCWDRVVRWTGPPPRYSIARCYFYVLQDLCESKSSQRRGIVALITVDERL
jgi:hypothetical protein